MGKKAEKRAIMAREGYDAKVGAEALMRAGKCKNLKGHVHEILFKDKFNADPRNIIAGRHAELTKSTTARVKDVIIKKNGKVVGHAQLKDVTSAKGVAKTAQQINAGKYAKTRVYGTNETAAKLAGKTKQPVHADGISSETTTRIANKALGKMPSIKGLHAAGKAGGVAGAAFGAGVEAVCSIKDVVNGKKSVEDAVGDVAVAGVRGGATGYASAVAGSAAAGVTGGLIAASGIGAAVGGTAVGAACVTAAPLVAGFAASCVVANFVSDLWDEIF